METPRPSAPDHGILVVDDTPATLQILTFMLAEAGYHVRSATDGELALCSAQSQPPDLILLDVRMPDLDGFEVCRRLKADERTRSIPIIFTTWLEEARDKVRGFQLGAVDYITKPFDSQEVLARISIHLSLRRTQMELQQTNERLTVEIAERERAQTTLHDLNESLEQRIAKHTAQLETANRELQAEIGEHQQMQAALQATKDRLELTYEEAGAGSWDWDITTGHIEWSSKMFDLFGLDPQTSRASMDTWRSVLHPEDRQAAESRINWALETHAELANEYRIVWPKGQMRWISALGRGIYDKQGQPVRMSGICIDITARKQVEEALRASEAKYHALFAEMMNGSALHEIVCDAAGRPVDYITLEVNKTYEGLLGVLGSAVVGKMASEFLPPDELEKWLGIFGPVALTGQSTHYSMHSPVNQKHFEGNAYCPEAGRFAVTFIDVTERAQAEAALRASETRYRELAEENARLLAQSRQDAETKAILLHEVNHRVKNNLAAVVGLLQMELRYPGRGEPRPYRSLVEDLTGRVQSLALVHNLLSASLWAPISLATLAKNVMRIAPVMLSRQQSVQMEISETPVLLTPKQASAVGLILNELATNSLKHALRPNEPMCLWLRAQLSGDGVILEYRDNGPGYPEEVLQAKHESVGLYLIEAMAEHDLEGKLTLSNERGAVARLRFALAPGVQPDSPQATLLPEDQTNPVN